MLTPTHAARAQPTEERRSPVGEPFRISGPEVELQFELRAQQVRGQDEDGERERDVAGLRAGINLELRQRLSSNLQARAEFELQAEQLSEDDVLDEDEQFLTRTRAMFLQYDSPDDALRVRLGRQGLDDQMSWYVDDDVDGLRVGLEGDDRLLDLSISRPAPLRNGLSQKDQTVTALAALAFDTGKKSTWTPWLVHRNDGDADAQSTWLGLQGVGRTTERLRYWFNAAARRGDERDDEDDIRGLGGYAIDLGATRVFMIPFRPSLTLGYAYASGDKDREDGDNGFRQTGLHSNEHRFGGISTFRYLGEVLDPELSNIAITTIGLGARIDSTLSLDLVYHAYRQATTDDNLRGSDLQFDPDGTSDALGTGLDIVVGYDDGRAIELQAVAGLFQPGSAFDEGTDNAWLLRLELEYSLDVIGR